MPFKQYKGAQRTESEILIYVAGGEPVPEQVPLELQPYVPNDVWNARLPSVRDLSSRYYKKGFEMAWFSLGFFSAIILPAFLYNVILQAMLKTNPNQLDTNGGVVDFNVEARFLSVGIFVGLVLLFFVPLAVWKFIGQRRANAMVGRWNRQDKMERSPNGFIPTWRVQMPGVFSSRCIIHVSTPPQTMPSAFHPDAYLPSYLNGPTDQGAEAYFYPYKGSKPGMPHMSMVGSLPGANAPNGGGNLPGYVAYGDEAEKFGSDEKVEFDDVKV
jgi:hypothetical protein